MDEKKAEKRYEVGRKGRRGKVISESRSEGSGAQACRHLGEERSRVGTANAMALRQECAW